MSVVNVGTPLRTVPVQDSSEPEYPHVCQGEVTVTSYDKCAIKTCACSLKGYAVCTQRHPA
jgi:hypothetical protein